MTAGSPDVSVVVPTRDRPGPLRRCLAALGSQTVDRLEVVVVDDRSEDAGAVADAVADAPHARLVVGEGRGPAAARNAGAEATRGAVLCFTDDDCVPTSRWAERLAAAVEGGAEAAAGPTRSPAGAGPVVSAAQLIASHLAEATRDPVTGRMRFAPTSNLACRAAVHRALPFDEHYPLAAGEDRDWCVRLRREGGTLVFAPDALVRHHQELTLSGFWRQQMRYGRGGWRFHRSRPGQWQSPRFHLGLLRAAFADGMATGLLVGAAQAATALGMAREALRDGRGGDPATA